jgi:hypothetical protein
MSCAIKRKAQCARVELWYKATDFIFFQPMCTYKKKTSNVRSRNDTMITTISTIVHARTWGMNLGRNHGGT